MQTTKLTRGKAMSDSQITMVNHLKFNQISSQKINPCRGRKLEETLLALNLEHINPEVVKFWILQILVRIKRIFSRTNFLKFDHRSNNPAMLI